MMDRDFDTQQYLSKAVSEKNNTIESFIHHEELMERIYSEDGLRVKILEDVNDSVGNVALSRYLNAYKDVAYERISLNCFDIAKSAVSKGLLAGRIATLEGATRFVGSPNHCVNYAVLGDGRVAAVDLTASVTIDEEMGNFDVLVITSENLSQLITRLNKLYGGTWEVKPS